MDSSVSDEAVPTGARGNERAPDAEFRREALLTVRAHRRLLDQELLDRRALLAERRVLLAMAVVFALIAVVGALADIDRASVASGVASGVFCTLLRTQPRPPP